MKTWQGRVLVVALIGVALLSAPMSAGAADLVYSGWLGVEGQSVPSVVHVIHTWNQQNPEHQVRWEGWPFSQALNQLMLRFNSGAPVNVAHINADWLPVLVAADALVDLGQVLDASVFETFDPGALAAGRLDGTQYALPRTVGSVGMIYNPEILRRAGLSQAPTTVAEFEAALTAIHNADPNVIPYAFAMGMDTLGRDFQMWLWTFGGSVFDENGQVSINNPQGVAALQWLKDQVDQGHIALGLTRFDARTLYANGLVGFYDDAVVAKGILRQQSGVAGDDELLAFARPMTRPVLNAGDPPAHLVWGHLVVVFKGENTDVASRFAAHVASTEAALVRYENEGVPPATKRALEDSTVRADGWISGWVPALTQTARPAETERFAEKATLDSIIAEEVQAALTGQKAVEAALNDAAQRLADVVGSR